MNDEIASKLEQLGEYVSILKDYQHFKIEDLQTDHTLKGAVERYLEIALECAIDIGEMIISREKLKRPGTYQEVFGPWGTRYFARGFCNKICAICGIQEQTRSYVRKNRYREASLLFAE